MSPGSASSGTGHSSGPALLRKLLPRHLKNRRWRQGTEEIARIPQLFAVLTFSKGGGPSARVAEICLLRLHCLADVAK